MGNFSKEEGVYLKYVEEYNLTKEHCSSLIGGTPIAQ
jgi:hypothetical protein